jgi:hypothetical protein
MITSQYKWFKAANSTTWVRLPMDEALSRPIKPNVGTPAPSNPPPPEPQKVLSDPAPPKKGYAPITAEQEAEIDRVWAEYSRRKIQDAQQNIERKKDYTWDECVRSLEESQKTSGPKPASKKEPSPIKVWVG